MKTKLLLEIAAASGAFVLVGGISVAALARSGAGSSTPPRLPVVSTPEVENDATETPDPEETHPPTHTETPEAHDQNDDEADDENDDSDDQGEDSGDQGENN